jgi:hypothetical protein
MSMKFTIECLGTERGWRYRVTLWCGRLKYVGESDYARHEDATRAARATGAVPKEEEEQEQVCA